MAERDGPVSEFRNSFLKLRDDQKITDDRFARAIAYHPAMQAKVKGIAGARLGNAAFDKGMSQEVIDHALEGLFFYLRDTRGREYDNDSEKGFKDWIYTHCKNKVLTAINKLVVRPKQKERRIKKALKEKYSSPAWLPREEQDMSPRSKLMIRIIEQDHDPRRKKRLQGLLAELSQKEIANQLGISPARVSQLIPKDLEWLRQQLDERQGEEEDS